MRISIWRQFSSNHSASFTVVGTFESPGKAAEVAAPLRQMMREIAIFWRDLSEGERYNWEVEVGDDYLGLTPAEQKWSAYFGVAWPKFEGDKYWRMDWLPPDPDKAETGVMLFGPHVLVSDIWSAWTPHTHIVAILENYGGQTARTSERDNLGLLVTVTCTAPDRATADDLMHDVAKSRGHYFKVAGEYSAYHRDTRIPLRDGLHLTYPLRLIRGFSLFDSQMESFQNYLEDYRCTNIRFEFTTVQE